MAAPVHPRRRGEHRVHCRHPHCCVGSSPQARGTLSSQRAVCVIDRFIPAGAGNTPVFQARKKYSAVHPRRRGEHSRRISARPMISGSSPQARGTLLAAARARRVKWFIPAGAGNTFAKPGTGATSSVHPRRRGEHFFAPQRTDSFPGSSPQARGTPLEDGAAQVGERFIPAGAGNTCD